MGVCRPVWAIFFSFRGQFQQFLFIFWAFWVIFGIALGHLAISGGGVSALAGRARAPGRPWPAAAGWTATPGGSAAPRRAPAAPGRRPGASSRGRRRAASSRRGRIAGHPRCPFRCTGRGGGRLGTDFWRVTLVAGFAPGKKTWAEPPFRRCPLGPELARNAPPAAML